MPQSSTNATSGSSAKTVRPPSERSLRKQELSFKLEIFDKITKERADLKDVQKALEKAKVKESEARKLVKELKAEIDAHQQMINRLADGDELPLWKDAKNGKQAEQPANEVAKPAQGSAADVAWESVTIQAAGVQDGLCRILMAEGIETLGQLVEWQQKDGGRKLTDMKGMGAKKAADLDAQLKKFHRQRKKAQA